MKYPYHSFEDQNGDEHVVLAPREPIPMCICMNCWNILDNTRAFCRRCGQTGTIFNYQRVSGEKCSDHPTTIAKEYCNYCSKPYCHECYKTNEGAILTTGTYSYYCFNCLKEIEHLKNQSEKSKEHITTCFRHRTNTTTEQCRQCGEKLCDYCSYFPVVGFFRKRFINKPLCFYCIRNGINQKEYGSWTIGKFRSNLPNKKYVYY